MSPPLVLSLFPGIGLLDMAFEQEGFCVVRGPDLTIPHPELPNRDFWLREMAELDAPPIAGKARG